MIDQPSIPSCEVCFVTYDLETRIPRNMPCCGKTLCRKCQEKMKRDNQRIRCPWCKYLHSAEAEFKTNFQLLGVIEENLKWEICAKHGEAIKLFCPQDKRKVCAYCLTLSTQGGCRDHELVQLTSLKPQADKARRNFENSLESLERKYPESKKKLGKDRETIEEMINQCFELQKQSIQESKIRTLHHFNLAYEKERAKFDENFGEDSSLRADLKKIISDHLNFLKSPDPKEIIDHDYSRLQNRLNYFTSSNSNGLSFEQQQSQFVPNMKKNILDQVSRTRNNWDSFIKNVEKKITTEVPEGFHNSAEAAICTKKDMLKFNSGLKFIIKSKSLTIEECTDVTESQLSLQQLQEINKVVFKFEALGLHDKDWDRIAQVFAELDTQQPFAFQLESSEKDPSINNISRLFSILCQKPEIIDELRLSLDLDDEIVLLINLILPHLSLLSSFHIKIQDAYVSPKSLNGFIENLHSIAPRLESLGLDFSNTKLPLSLFKKIFIKMPVLKSFSLNASRIANFSQETISPLLEDTKNLMPKLEELILNVSQTKIPASDAAVLKDRFRHIKNVELKLKDPESKRAKNQVSQSQISPPKSKKLIPIDDEEEGISRYRDDDDDDDDDDVPLYRDDDDANYQNSLVNRVSGNGRNQSPAVNRIFGNGQNQRPVVNYRFGNGPRIFGNNPFSQGSRY